MSETPPILSHATVPAPTRLSRASLTSMILGILLCIRGITSLAAVLFAIVGFRATRNPNVRGRGFAIAGLSLGLVGLLMWSGVGALVGFLLIGSQAPRATLREFVADFSADDIHAASGQCNSSITPAAIETLHEYVAPFGAYRDLTCSSINLQTNSGRETCALTGTVEFTSGSHNFTATVVEDPTGKWKILNFHVY